jgi:hypothetical protein
MEKHWWDSPRRWQWWVAVGIIFLFVIFFGWAGVLYAVIIFVLYFWLTGNKKMAKKLLGTKKEWVLLGIVFLVIVLFLVLLFFSVY